MKITRFLNGNLISEKNFKNISIKNENIQKIVSNAAKRATKDDLKNE